MLRPAIVFSLLLLFCLTTTVSADRRSGEELFNAKDLGTNGRSCNSCHPQGKGLEKIGEYDQEMLKEMINFCIRDALKGKRLSAEAPELAVLEAYIRTFKRD